MLFGPIFGDFWCPVVTVVTFSSNLSNFERNQKKEDAIRPELSCPARFRIQGGSTSVTEDGGRTNERTNGNPRV